MCKGSLVKMSLICKKLNLYMELIFTWIVLLEVSFWHRAKRQLGHVVLIRSSIHGSPFTDTFPDTLKLKRYLALSHPTKKTSSVTKRRNLGVWRNSNLRKIGMFSDFGVGRRHVENGNTELLWMLGPGPDRYIWPSVCPKANYWFATDAANPKG